MPPADVAVPVLRRATAPWRRSIGGSCRRAPEPVQLIATAGRGRPSVAPRVGAGRIARQSPRSRARTLPPGRWRTVRRGGRGPEGAGAAEAESPLAGLRRGADEPRRLDGPRTARRCCAPWAPMVPPQTGVASGSASVIRSSAAASGVRARRSTAIAISRSASARYRATAPGRVGARARRGARRTVPRSPRVIGPVRARGDAERPGVAEGLLDQRAVDREAAGLVEAGDAAELGDRVEQRVEAARGEHGGGVVGGLGAGREADGRGRRSPRPSGRAGRASWSSPSIAIVAPWSAATARSVSAKATSGWNEPTCVPAAIAGARTSAPSRPLVWIIAWPLYMWSRAGDRRDRVVGDGEDDQLDLVDERRRPRRTRGRPGRGRGTARAAPASRLATAWTGQPARSRATPRAVPTAPAPTIPMTGGSPGVARDVGVGCAGSASWSWSAWSCRGSPAVAGRRARPRPLLGRRRRVEVDPGRVELAQGRRRRVRATASSSASPQAFTSGAAGSRARGPDPESRYSSIRASVPTEHDGGRVTHPDPFGARASLGAGLPDYFRLAAIGDRIDLERAPVTLKILLENVLRHAGGGIVEPADVETLASWRPGVAAEAEVPFMPARVLLQDFTGVPAVVDLAVMRDAMADLGGDPARVNPLVPADLVIDHSRPGRPVRDAGRVRLQRRARVRAQRRALPAPALGPDRVPRPAGRAARDGHRPPGQPRVPRQRRDRRAGPGAAAAGSPSRTRSSGPTRTRR